MAVAVMTGRRHRSMLRAFVWWVPSMAVLALLGSAEALVRHGLAVATLIVLLPPAAFVAGRQLGRRGAQAGSNAARELAQLQAAVEDLEDAAGRSLQAIIASYRTIQGRYAKKGRQS